MQSMNLPRSLFANFNGRQFVGRVGRVGLSNEKNSSLHYFL